MEPWRRKVPPSSAFAIGGGRLLYSLQDLEKELAAMHQDTFKMFVTPQKDDFGHWINDALGDSDLATRLWGIRDVDIYHNTLKVYLEQMMFFGGLKAAGAWVLGGALVGMIIFAVVMQIDFQQHTRDSIDEIRQRQFDLYGTELRLLVAADSLRAFTSSSSGNLAILEHPEPIYAVNAGPTRKINKSQIQVMPDRITITVANASWGVIANTSSMVPTLTTGAFGLQVKPNSEGDIHEGDIVVFQLKDELIVHRVARVGIDNKGWFAITKGDYNPIEDPEKVRFDQIIGIVIGVIY